jgi:ATP-dependent DNA helicase RecQ
MLRIAEVMKKTWGYDGFRPHQEEAIHCLMNNHDSVVVLPTGGGKSLCFQAPAVVHEGVAIIVSPLISLMKDQVDALRECGVPAACLNSSLSASERRSVEESIRSGELKLLYVAPERLVTPHFIEYLKSMKLSFIAVDEAHCISAWGHDFRPEYRQLSILRDTFPSLPIAAYTATATDIVREDIAKQLNLKKPKMLVGSYDRPNLIYYATRRSNLIKQVCEVIDRHPGESGIIYCIRRKDVDKLCQSLIDKGYKALPYHAGLSDMDRKSSQDAFINERVDIIVATVAFGMGIDKSNVRYVVHAGMPKSLEHYQQESGRAGRDGLEAECHLFYSGGDLYLWKTMLSDLEQEAQTAALNSLSSLYSYCTGIDCRHQSLVAYFGQSLDKESCEACDICLGQAAMADDPLAIGQKIISCVLRLQERYGADYTALVLTGSKDSRILENEHDSLSTYGLLASDKKSTVRDWIEQLVGQGYLEKTSTYLTLTATAKGRQMLKGEETPRLSAPPKEKPKEAKVAKDSWAGVDRELFEALRALRAQKAKQHSVPAFIIFGDATLRDMARCRPTTKEEFLQVSGVGEKKCREYAHDFTRVIADYCNENGVASETTQVEPKQPVKTRTGSGNRTSQAKELAGLLFNDGEAIEEVAQKIGRAHSVALGYLEQHIKSKGIIDPAPWVDETTFEKVTEAASQVGFSRMRTLYDHLNEEVGYNDLRICIACIMNKD